MFNSLKTRIIIIVSVMILVLMAGSAWFSYQQATDILEQTIFEEAKTQAGNNADLITEWVRGYTEKIDMLARLENIRYMVWLTQKDIIGRVASDDEDIEMMFVATPEGRARTTSGVGSNISDREYFKKVMETGETVISKPLVNKVTGEQIIVVASPIKDNDEVITGVIGATVKLTYLQELIKGMDISGYGYGYIIDSEMTTVAHPEAKYLGNKEILKAGNQEFKEVVKKMAAGEEGTDSYIYNGAEKMMAYAPVELTGWSVAMGAEIVDVLAPLDVIKNSSLLTALIGLLLGIFITYFVARSITNPIIRIQKAAEKIASGDLTVDTNTDKFKINEKDEIGSLFTSINTMADNLRNMVGQIISISQQVAASSEELSASGDQVGESAQQVGTAIQEVASGAEEQSAQVEQITVNINDLNKQIEGVGGMTGKLSEDGQVVMETIEKGTDAVNHSIEQIDNVKAETTDVSQTIDSLGELSDEIGNIVELINDIAAQTNLLALNAAIEAARAGEAGRGFSVVADEIRDLAEDSSSATEKIASLINKMQQGISQAVSRMDQNEKVVDDSVKAIGETGDAFTQIQTITEELNSALGKISAEAEKMSENSRTVQSAIDDVAAASQEAAGNAEEVAASSEEQSAATEEIISSANELAEMAARLSEAVDQFKV